MPLFGKTESYLGVDIGAGGIKFVEFKKTKGRPQLWTYGMIHEDMDIHVGAHEKTPEELVKQEEQAESREPVPAKAAGPIDIADPRIDRYAALLKELLKQGRAQSKRVTASLPVSHVFHAVVTLPKVDKKELNHHVQAKVKKMLPRPIEEMQVVHEVIPPRTPGTEAKDMKVLVTAAPRELVAFYTAIFQRAGLQLEELETEAFALERSLVGKDTATVLLADIGAERSNFFIVDQGLPITHRSLQIGGNQIDRLFARYLDVDPDMVGQLKQDVSRLGQKIPVEPFMSVVEPIAKEIQYSIDLFLHQSGNEAKQPEKIILTGGSALFPPILSFLQQSSGIKTFIGDPWGRVVYQDGLKPLLDPIGPRMAVAIGLALRNIV